jgi:hypothetical protein
MVETSHDAAAVFQQAFSLVRFRLGNVNMKARIGVGGDAAACIQRFIAHGEGSVQAEKPAQQIASGTLATLKKRAILFNTLLCDFSAFAIRDFVA